MDPSATRCPRYSRAMPYGFTLIELLVVVAIITIIAALLFPVFSHAREKARQSSCLSNERQIATAMLLYTQDYDELLPYWNAAFLTKPATPETPDKLWKYAVQSYLKNGNPSYYVLNGVVYPETGVWQCSDIGAWKDGLGVIGGVSAGQLPTRPASASYGMSMFLAYTYFDTPMIPGNRYRPGMPLAALRAPSNTIMIGESGIAGRIDTPIQRRWLYFQQNYQNPMVQNWERRDAHSGGSNYAFCDGHLHWLNAETAYPTDVNAAKIAALTYFAATDADYLGLGGK